MCQTPDSGDHAGFRSDGQGHQREGDGIAGPVKDIVIEPEFLDVTVPAGVTFTHPVKNGHTAFAYAIEGKGYFDPGRNSFGHEIVGANYFDFQRECLVGAGELGSV